MRVKILLSSPLLGGEWVDWEVGQKVWVEKKGLGGTSYEGTIIKVGRRWGYLDYDKDKFDLETRELVNPWFPTAGMVWRDFQECLAARALRAEWHIMKTRLSVMHEPPWGLTIEDIYMARTILRIEEEEEI